MKSVEQTMKDVFSQPTAPFRENWVLHHVQITLKNLRVPYFIDIWGNVIAGAPNPRVLRKSKKVALVAHTDHPGFHILKPLSKNLFLAQWFGGCPPKILGALVAIYHPQKPGQKAVGIIRSRKLTGKAKNLLKIQISRAPFDVTSSCFGAFNFSGFERRGKRVFSRAADDLAGATIILATLARLKTRERKNILGLFTRAEEVGYRGALGIIYKNVLGKGNSVISLEASRQLEGARIGKGPVIRLGDRRTLFDSHVTARLDEAAKKIRVQRRIMNGGTCEATAFNLHGIAAAGITVPLGNYHNQRANGKPGPEFISLSDVEGAVSLCVEFYRQASRNVDPMNELVKKMALGFKKDQKYFRKKVEFAHAP